ncbi:MAG: hypothetical protein ABR590_10470 [Spirochaetia bacterium]
MKKRFLPVMMGTLVLVISCMLGNESSDLDGSSTCEPLYVREKAVLSTQPYIGTNFTHYGDQLEGYSILQNYHQHDVCGKVQNQLVTMRSRGAQTIRILIWHYDATEAQNWGVIPHRLASGEIGIPEPYRTNLIRYLQDIDSAGYARVIIGFAPMADNNPFQDWQNCQADYFDAGDPDYFEQNWEFIQVVRELAVTHGPDEVRFDLLNEGVPNEWLDLSCEGGKSTRAQVKQYGSDMLQAFFAGYGEGDATISAITSARVVCPTASTYTTDVLEGSFQDLLDMHGSYSPGWFALHMYGADDPNCAEEQELEVVYQSLLAADAFFDGDNAAVPFVIQETYHNNSVVASKIEQFIGDGSGRGIQEVISWPHTQGSSIHIDVVPPYVFDEYRSLQ